MKIPRLSSVWRAAKSGQLRYVVPHYYYRWRNPGSIVRTPPVSAAAYGSPGAIEVCMMTGESQHYDLLLAAKSFLKLFPGPVSLSVHCDKSVTPESIARIEAHLPNVRVWSRPQRDAEVVPYLKKHGYATSERFREQYVFSTRLLDAFILTKADRILFLDSDILSFRPLDRLHRLATGSRPLNLFGKDPAAETHGLGDAQLRALFGITDIKHHLNGGFCLVHRSAVDHALIERWLNVPNFPWSNYFLEQMFLVMLMAEDWGRSPDVEVLPEAEYNMARTIERAEDTCALVHYCGHYLGKTRISMQSVGQPRVVRELMAG